VKRPFYAVPTAIWVVLRLATSVPHLAMPQTPLSGAVADGRRTFYQSCAACHDTLGTTRKSGPGLKDYYHRHPRPADRGVRMLIEQGKGRMPAFATFNKPQIDDLIAYLKTL
jgi:mono/diheme cytochrome c family protein